MSSFRTTHFYAVPWENGPPRDINNEIIQMKTSLDQLKDDSNMQEIKRTVYLNGVKALIYFSNSIENAGLNQSDTYVLIEKMVGDNNYQMTEDDLILKTNVPKPYAKMHGKREVAQHLLAYRYLCEEKLNSELTIDIIKETHRILTNGLLDGKNRPINAGEFRTEIVAVDFTTYSPVDDIRPSLFGLIAEYNEQINEIDKTDPSQIAELAASVSFDFVMIHPFIDGNGRMSRLIMNHIAMKCYIPSPISFGYGAHKHAKIHYLYSIRKDSGRFDYGFRPVRIATMILASMKNNLVEMLYRYKIDVERPRQYKESK